MNAVEIEEAVSDLALQPFDGDEFPYAFLIAFGNKDTTIRKLRSAKNSSNSSDISGGALLLTTKEKEQLLSQEPAANRFVYRYVGSADFIKNNQRSCLWITDENLAAAERIDFIRQRMSRVKKMRLTAKASTTKSAAQSSHKFIQIQNFSKKHSLVIPRVSSATRYYLPVGLLPRKAVVSDSAQAIYDSPLWNMALIASRIHLVWIASVCGKLKTDFRYSNTLGWNTFQART